MKKMNHLFLISLTIIFLSAGCTSSNEVGTSASNPSTSSNNIFPEGLAITSPLASGEESSDDSEVAMRSLKTPAYATAYEESAEEIDSVLEGDSIADCVFDASKFVVREDNANCYGPRLPFENHPDYNPADHENSEDGMLPPLDVGFWGETETNGEGTDTGEACAAAEMNAITEGISAKTDASLMVMAFLVCVTDNNDLSLPNAGEILDLTDEANTAATDNGISATLSSASLANNSTAGISQYDYDVEMTSGDNEITVVMEHRPDDADDADTPFTGRLSYQVNTTLDNMGNCPSTDGTLAGSALYSLDADGIIAVRADEGTFCGHDADVLTDGVLDPSKWDSGNNYSVFIANFETTTEGQYAHAWQAGTGDGYTRVFNVDIATDDESGDLSAEAFFGYGKDVNDEGDEIEEGFNGSIDGFICNWAGPGQFLGTSDEIDEGHQTQLEANQVVQRQTMVKDGDMFTPETSNITYAPTTTCNYDAEEEGDAEGEEFAYDLDGNETISDDERAEVAAGITNDLFDMTEASFVNFDLPTEPDNF